MNLVSRLLALSLALGAAVHAQPQYRVIEIPTLGGAESRVFRTNDFGAAVGYSTNAAGQEEAFVWLPSANYGLNVGVNGLGLPQGSTFSRARSINDRGEVLGYTDDPAGNTVLALWLPTARLNYARGWNVIGGLGGDFAAARYCRLQNDLTFVGTANTSPGGPWQAILHLAVAKWGRQPGLYDLTSGDPSVTWARLRGISPTGIAVGDAQPAGTSYFGTATWSPNGGWTFPDRTASFGGRGSAISKRGFIAGSRGPVSGLWDGYLGLPPFHTLLPRLYPAPGDAWIHDVNDRGEVVGHCRPDAFKNAQWRATSWARGLFGATPVDLHTVVPNLGAWDLQRAFSVSNSGMIAGRGTLGGQTRGFLLVPLNCQLGVFPSLPSAGARITFQINGAAARRPVAIVSVDLNGNPVQELLAFGSLDEIGSADLGLGFPVPPGLTGATLRVKAVSLDAVDGALIESQPATIAFQ